MLWRWQRLWGAMNDALNLIINGKASPEDALINAVETIKAQIGSKSSLCEPEETSSGSQIYPEGEEFKLKLSRFFCGFY